MELQTSIEEIADIQAFNKSLARQASDPLRESETMCMKDIRETL